MVGAFFWLLAFVFLLPVRLCGRSSFNPWES